MSFLGDFHQSRKILKAQKLTNEAIFLFQMGDLHEAKVKCTKALEAKEDHAPAWNLLGSALMKENRYEEASECFKKVLRYDKFLITAYPVLALCYRALGKHQLAIKTLKEGQALFNSKEYANEVKLWQSFEANGMFENMISGSQSISEFQKTIKKTFDDAMKELKQ